MQNGLFMHFLLCLFLCLGLVITLAQRILGEMIPWLVGEDMWEDVDKQWDSTPCFTQPQLWLTMVLKDCLFPPFPKGIWFLSLDLIASAISKSSYKLLLLAKCQAGKMKGCAGINNKNVSVLGECLSVSWWLSSGKKNGSGKIGGNPLFHMMKMQEDGLNGCIVTSLDRQTTKKEGFRNKAKSLSQMHRQNARMRSLIAWKCKYIEHMLSNWAGFGSVRMMVFEQKFHLIA